MKIYLVTHGDYDSYGILGAYETLEQAREVWLSLHAGAKAYRAFLESDLDDDKIDWDNIPRSAGGGDRHLLLEELELGMPIASDFPDPSRTLATYNAETDEIEWKAEDGG